MKLRAGFWNIEQERGLDLELLNPGRSPGSGQAFEPPHSGDGLNPSTALRASFAQRLNGWNDSNYDSTLNLEH